VTTRIRIAKPADAGRVRAAYATWDYARPIAPDDTIWLAESANEVVGIVRIAREFGTLVLRGMRIAEGWQRRGIGSRMLLEVDAWLGKRKCYCIPYSHLGEFYGQIGFQIIEVDAAPLFLRGRIDEYRRASLDVMVMLRAKTIS
jgi:GNAT superfamily N-acetyltransferase